MGKTVGKDVSADSCGMDESIGKAMGESVGKGVGKSICSDVGSAMGSGVGKSIGKDIGRGVGSITVACVKAKAEVSLVLPSLAALSVLLSLGSLCVHDTGLPYSIHLGQITHTVAVNLATEPKLTQPNHDPLLCTNNIYSCQQTVTFLEYFKRVNIYN